MLIAEGGWAHRLLRQPLRLVPKGAVLPILGGVNRGLRWRVGAGIHRCWLGWYEADKLAVFARLVPRGGVVFDVGAHAGYYALAASRLVGPAGRVVAFEPLPANVADLRHHVALNRLANVEIVPRPVGGEHGAEVSFETEGLGSYRGRIAAGAAGEAMRAVALDAFLAETGGAPPDVLKMDVEGAESAVLDGAEGLLAAGRTSWLVALHSMEQQALCAEALLRHGHTLWDFAGRRLEPPFDAFLWEVVALPPGRAWPTA